MTAHTNFATKSISNAASQGLPVEHQILLLKAMHGRYPDDIETLWQLGQIYLELKNTTVSREWIFRLLKQDPTSEAGMIQLLQIELIENNREQAQYYLDILRSSKNLQVSTQKSLAKILFGLGSYNEAIALFSVLIEADPNDVDSLRDLGNCFKRSGEIKTAVHYYDRALSLSPNDAHLYVNLAVCLIDMANFDAAIICFDAALMLDPKLCEAYNGLGVIALQKKDFKSAFNFFSKGLSIEPDHDLLAINLGICHLEMQAPDKAEPYLLKAMTPFLELEVDKLELHHFNRIHSIGLASLATLSLEAADWSLFNKIRPLLIKMTQLQLDSQIQTGIMPFTALYTLPRAMSKAVAENYARFHQAPQSLQLQPRPIKNKKTLKIGYVSADFNLHPVGLLLRSLFSHHDRDLFHITAYSLSPIIDNITKIIQQSSDEYKIIANMSYQSAAELIHDDEIDILIDFSGYTSHAKPYIFGFKPAPVQCFFLGYLATMGASYIDYHITHESLIPSSARDLYTEKLVFLPSTPFATAPFEAPKRVATRQDYQLPEKQFVFCCFAQSYRIDERVFQAWLEILERTPNSILWLSQMTPKIKDNLMSYTEQRGIDPQRLHFRSFTALSQDWHHSLADVWLDPFILSSGTASYLCAWVGLPIVSLRSELPQGRLSSFLMEVAGVPEMACDTIENYIELAIDLAHNPEKLFEIRARMIDCRTSSVIFDQVQYAKDLEQAYMTMWENMKHGNEDRDLRVVADSRSEM